MGTELRRKSTPTLALRRQGWPGESRALEVFLGGGAQRAWAPSSGPGAVEDLLVRSQTLVFVSSPNAAEPKQGGLPAGCL